MPKVFFLHHHSCSQASCREPLIFPSIPIAAAVQVSKSSIHSADVGTLFLGLQFSSIQSNSFLSLSFFYSFEAGFFCCSLDPVFKMDSIEVPRKLWEHANPESTEMYKFMQAANKKHNLELRVSLLSR